jgi:4'-phosphopantetheinyl transferase
VGGLLMRLALKVNADSDLVFGPYGRPSLNRGDCHFSLSHSGDWVALSVGEQRHGLDVEKNRSKAVPSSLAAKVLTKEELNYFDRCGSDDSVFITLWTFKESLIKATGEGLARPLTSFSVWPPGPGEKTVLGSQWFFHLRSLPGATLALAVEGQSSEPTYHPYEEAIQRLLAQQTT